MNRPKGEISMSVFDEYKGEMHPIIKNADLLNIPFRIQRMKDRTNVTSDYGTKDSMLCTIEIIETGEVFTYFGLESSRTLPPKAITLPLMSIIGNIALFL